MSGYENLNLCELLKNNAYPGRGVVVGTTADGTHAVAAYFIMGRSANSRNRVFKRLPDGTVDHRVPSTRAGSEDPSLIIYNAVSAAWATASSLPTATRPTPSATACARAGALPRRSRAAASSRTRPTTPPASARILTFGEQGFAYQMSILKSADAQGSRLQPGTTF